MTRASEWECNACSMLFEDERSFNAHQHEVIVCKVPPDRYQKITYPDRVVYRLRGADEPEEIVGMELKL